MYRRKELRGMNVLLAEDDLQLGELVEVIC